MSELSGDEIGHGDDALVAATAASTARGSSSARLLA